ncbi:hypothetical protein DUNSADRAFT_7260 [Dunaliella salina]|uniref:Uncharacterized protein n=1 Tax=Dunaliella salina TaxID=3046 RepID=A0ABQ7GLN8_DUNSA|nr:hypothetical protein DUNSADRAFT_7260 [Dunaliella salina]|eukprot:KAF5835521.1 hypothetical protein DUNSADRAFT_7260 [Dunaliella salina]
MLSCLQCKALPSAVASLHKAPETAAAAAAAASATGRLGPALFFKNSSEVTAPAAMCCSACNVPMQGAANAVASLHKAPETAAAAAAAATGRLGRALFCKNAAQAARAGMLGALVKLNLGAMPLQPGCDQGPMAAHERATLAAMMEARKAQNPLRNLPRDDVGIVVRDAGPGTWRGLMVRKLGSTEGFWYDEAVLLPATNSDIHKQVLRRGPGYMLPRHAQGVPVTDANAAPGMLVQRAYSAGARAYSAGAVLDGSEKATMLGELLRPAGAHMWEVQWRDGTVGVYKTGANNKFQLCFLNLHAATGAPLLYSTVVNQAAIGATRMPVTDGPHCVAGGAEPGEQEVSLLNAAGMVVTSTGERRSCGSMLRLYELSHAIVPGDALTIYTTKRGLHVALIEYTIMQQLGSGDALTIYTAKRGLHVALIEYNTEQRENDVEGTNGPSKGPVAPQRRDPTAEEEHEEMREDEEAEAAPKKVEQTEHFVRMVEPIMLLPTRDEMQDKKLVSLAKPLQRAIGWNNQLMRELCRVWWWSSRLAAAEREEQQKQAEPDGGPSECTQLWRPQLTLTPSQPDQLSLVLCAREPEMLRWTPLTEDKEGTVMNLVGMPLDEELAEAVGQLTMALAETPSRLTPYGLHQ